MRADIDLSSLLMHPMPDMREGDHRIANSLSMIASLVRLQARDLSGAGPLAAERAQAMVLETASRIDAVARLHRRLANTAVAEGVDPADLVRDIALHAQLVFDPEERVRLSFDLTRGVCLPASQSAALGLIVNEALINALKYAHPAHAPGVIRLVCRPVFGDSLLVAIEDDGVGLPEGVSAEGGGGMGFRIMRTLAAQIGATLSCRSSPLGLTVQALVRL